MTRLGRIRPTVTAFTLVVMAVLPILGLASPAFADTSSASAAEGLQISPAEVQLNADPGRSYTINLKVTNVTATDLIFDSVVNDFTAKDETGTPQIIENSTLPSTASIRTWVTAIPEFTLPAHQTRQITAVLSVPESAEPGGHYGVIRFIGRTASQTNVTGVSLNASAGTLVLIRVSGNITEKLELPTFTTTDTNGKQASLFETGPISFEQRYQNTGNVHVAPIGQIIVKDAFGNVVGQLKVNSSAGNVLPGSVRRFDTELNKTTLFGRYTADLTVSYGTTGGAIVRSISFWVIPYKIVLVGLIILITLIYILRMSIKRYNRYIIHNHNNKKQTHHDKKTRTKKQ
jgi:hypothetical protein